MISAMHLLWIIPLSATVGASLGTLVLACMICGSIADENEQIIIERRNKK